ncbi:unnamed protein product [Paramecium octaurelia]|uniref:Uncharacterized protein n=1 Tax=Paramecium octaurelia TaxID=43137 RepID=A0A8S1U4Z9_PAROT|nr:unnamed protein product [Paramecium octaurelia]
MSKCDEELKTSDLFRRRSGSILINLQISQKTAQLRNKAADGFEIHICIVYSMNQRGREGKKRFCFDQYLNKKKIFRNKFRNSSYIEEQQEI